MEVDIAERGKPDSLLDAVIENAAKHLASLDHAIDELVHRMEGLLQEEPPSAPEEALSAVRAPQSRVIRSLYSHAEQIERIERHVRSITARLDV